MITIKDGDGDEDVNKMRIWMGRVTGTGMGKGDGEWGGDWDGEVDADVKWNGDC